MAEITKLDAARRQLLAAIHIHWYLEEPLAVYTLAANSWEIADALLSQTTKLRMIDQFVAAHGKPAKDFRNLLNEPRNFIKHADRDPFAVAPDITDEDCDGALIFACLDYMIIAGRSPYILGLFVAWYSAVYPSKTGDFFRREADLEFPGLGMMSRRDQRAAARASAAKWGKSPLMADARMT
ncbi:hypothetical protein [Mesorhizobium muleiense]|uniref:Uncharacterized protein n=1 Tax=Mesorhizobium muleiense TaxID=1004279 RepID=A0A1G9BVP2_9HYPH|nr:hypothetical protein [Mesorhizobium muleiense]MCF6103847.1 hypothetical protein [Mesorhizobium muleiense]SDK43450.1 hypothetical protein SAMN05428953_11581 [Mesorhizobium muleiense]